MVRGEVEGREGGVAVGLGRVARVVDGGLRRREDLGVEDDVVLWVAIREEGRRLFLEGHGLVELGLDVGAGVEGAEGGLGRALRAEVVAMVEAREGLDGADKVRPAEVLAWAGKG